MPNPARDASCVAHPGPTDACRQCGRPRDLAGRCGDCADRAFTDECCDECGAWISPGIPSLVNTAHEPSCSLHADSVVEPAPPGGRRRSGGRPSATLRRAALTALGLLAPDASRNALANWLDHGSAPPGADRGRGRLVAEAFATSDAGAVVRASASLTGVLLASSGWTARVGAAVFDADRGGYRVVRVDGAIVTVSAGTCDVVVIEDGSGSWTAQTGLPADCGDPLRIAKRIVKLATGR